jgi:hypothetical protein
VVRCLKDPALFDILTGRVEAETTPTLNPSPSSEACTYLGTTSAAVTALKPPTISAALSALKPAVVDPANA